MREDNRGFSFVELLVVIAIMAVIMTMSASGIVYLNNTNSKKAVASIESSMNLVRNNTTAYKNQWELKLEMDSDKRTYARVYKDGTLYSETSLGNIQIITLNVTSADGGTSQSQTINRNNISNAPIRFTFKNTTGGFDELTLGGTEKEALTTQSSFGTLTVTTTANTTTTIKLFFVSGKVDVI
jgi:prepilin-type N-terminal cleavage/methylation domain-containing protein